MLVNTKFILIIEMKNSFLDNDLTELEKTENIQESMDKLKKYWTTLNDVNKEKVWKYFEILLKLSKMI